MIARLLPTVLVLATLGLASGAAGLLATRRLRAGGETCGLAFVLITGLAVWGHALVLLAMAGALQPTAVAALAAVLVVAVVRDVGRPLPGQARPAWSSLGPVEAVGALLLASTLVLTLYPPLGFDQTMYHWPMARAFAETGSLPALPDLRYPVFPPLFEALVATVLQRADDVAAQAVGWLGLLLAVLLAVHWTRETAGRAAGWLAGAIVLGSPCAVYLAATGYVEPVLAAFTLAALRAVDRAVAAVAAGQSARARDWAVLAGALAGSAAATKYHGLLVVAAACVLVALQVRRPGGWPAFAWCVGAAVATAGPTYARLVWLTGSPVFPFYPALFGSSAWAAQDHLGAGGLAHVRAAATFLFDITFRRHLTGGMPFWSPAFVLGLPCAWLAWRTPGWRGLTLVAGVTLLLAPVQAHHFLGMAPVWAVLIAVVVARRIERVAGGTRAVGLLALALSLGGPAYVAHRVWRLGPPPTTVAARDALLTRQLPLYAAVRAIRRVDSQGAIYGVDAERMRDYARGPWRGDHSGPARYDALLARARRERRLSPALRDLDVAYLLVPVSEAEWVALAGSDPALSLAWRDGAAVVYRIEVPHALGK